MATVRSRVMFNLLMTKKYLKLKESKNILKISTWFYGPSAQTRASSSKTNRTLVVWKGSKHKLANQLKKIAIKSNNYGLKIWYLNKSTLNALSKIDY